MPSAVSTACPVVWAGESLELLPERALWWPARRTLFIADLHIGKAATYRALGQPVPGGTTQENLDRLDALIARHAPAALVFLATSCMRRRPARRRCWPRCRPGAQRILRWA